MKILDIDQNTEEWEEYRKGKSGGSAFGKIVKVSGRNSDKLSDQFFKILAERVARPMTPNDYLDLVPDGMTFSWAVRGHILEPEAARAFEVKTGKILDDGKVWQSDYDEASYVSPDRVIKSPDGKIREAVEIKCLSSENVLKVWWNMQHKKDGESDIWCIPTNDYQAQALKYFMVNEDLETLYWVMYTDLIPGLSLQILTIKRGDIKELVDMAREVEKSYLDNLKYAENLLTSHKPNDTMEL